MGYGFGDRYNFLIYYSILTILFFIYIWQYRKSHVAMYIIFLFFMVHLIFSFLMGRKYTGC